MRITLNSFCACLVLLFVLPENAPAQSITVAADSIFSAIELTGAPAQTTARPPVAFENCDAYRLRAKTHKVISFATLPLLRAEPVIGQCRYLNATPGKKDAHLVTAAEIGLLLASAVIVSSTSDAVAQSTPNDPSLAMFRSVVVPGTAGRPPGDFLAIVKRGGEGTTLNTQKPNPLPEHTGFSTLAKDTVSDFVAFPKRKSTWVFLATGLGAALVAHQADDYVAEHIVGSEGADKFFKLGKVVGSAGFQTGSALSLWLVGRYVVSKNEDGSRSNRLSHLGLDLLRAQIVSQAMVYATKYAVQRDRPTGECCAFPSGHATSAFSSAAVFERHFGERGSWWALTAASYVAASRLVDNRHFLSDVVFGAALGEAVGWTVVGRHGRDRYVLRAFPVKGGGMIAITNN